mgnify:CR=1 FL=1
MSDELEQTIEELEAEVLAELEEASEKPLGKAKDLGLGSNNAGDDVSNASKPAPKQAGAESADSVEGDKGTELGGAKPEAKVTTPITSAIKALKKLNINKISIFTPYTKEINDSIINYFKKENITINSLSYFDIASDIDIGKVDEKHLFNVLSKIELKNSEALFVSCTALPVLSIIDKLEKKLKKIVLSSNQTLIWDSLNQINFKEKIAGFGKLFNS